MQVTNHAAPQQSAIPYAIATSPNDVPQASSMTGDAIAETGNGPMRASRNSIPIDQPAIYGTDSVDDANFDIRKASPRMQARWMAPNGLLGR